MTLHSESRFFLIAAACREFFEHCCFYCCNFFCYIYRFYAVCGVKHFVLAGYVVVFLPNDHLSASSPTEICRRIHCYTFLVIVKFEFADKHR